MQNNGAASLVTLALALTFAAPVRAEMLSGADDPAFRDALSTLLAADDPAAVATLHDLAEAGNAAALVTLPLALQWVPPTGSLKDRNVLRRVGGVDVRQAAASVHAASDLWASGETGDARALPGRAAGLLDLGETEKAAILLYGWLNQTGGTGDFPSEILSDQVPAMLGAFALADRLRRSFFHDGPVADDAARLLGAMRAGRLSGWLAYVQLTVSDPEIFDRIGSPLAGTGLSATEAETRIAEAQAVRSVWFGFAWDDRPTPAAEAELARTALYGRTEFRPVTALCQAHCPDSVATCEAAVLVYPGQPFGFGGWQPFADVLDPAAFAASDRGLVTLLRARQDLAAPADRATAEGLDACYAGLLARRDGISLAP